MLLIYYFSLFKLRYIFARTIYTLLLDKHSITLNFDMNANIIQYNILKCLTVVGNFPHLMKFGHFNAPRSWSLLHLLTWFFFYFVKTWVMNNIDHGFCVFSITAARRQNSSGGSKMAFLNNFPDRLYFPQVCIKKCPWSKLFIAQFLTKLKKNQVNRCSRLEDLRSWKWPNFLRRGKLPTTVKSLN